MPGDEDGKIDSSARMLWRLVAGRLAAAAARQRRTTRSRSRAHASHKDGRHVLYLEHATRYGAPMQLRLLDLATGRSRPVATMDGGYDYYGLHDWAGDGRLVPALEPREPARLRPRASPGASVSRPCSSSSSSRPAASNFSCARVTGSSSPTTRAPATPRILRRSACAHRAPNWPGLAPTTATVLFVSGASSRGREPQSTAFFSPPGTEPLYSGVAKRIASAAPQSSRSRRDGLRQRVAVEVLVVQRQVADPVPELDLHARGRRLGGGPQELGVVRAGAEAAGDGEDLHRQPSCRTSASSTRSLTSLAT